MLQKNITEEIDEFDPWARDKLGRKAIAEYLTPVIASINQPFVVGLHSSYGTGKTFFVKSWQQDLKNKGFKTAYFNAWETDFSQDAMAAFISSLKKEFVPSKDVAGYEGKLSKFSMLVKKTGGFLYKNAIPILAKAAARKVLSDDELKELSEDLSREDEETLNVLSNLAEDAVSSQELAENSMISFKAYLEDLVAELITEKTGVEDEEKRHPNEEQTKKLIIFVDELDRCRPTYAIEVLECIKHLFSVDNIVFVLSIDDEQIKNSIASVYGRKLDGEGYLRRFIDWSFIIPKPSISNFLEYLVDGYELQSLGFWKNNDDFYSVSALLDSFEIVTRNYSVSMREIKQLFIVLNLCLRNISPHACPLSEVLGFFLVFSSVENELCEKIIKKEIGFRDVIKYICEKFTDNSYYGDFGDRERFIFSISLWLLDETGVTMLREENARYDKLSVEGTYGSDDEKTHKLNEELIEAFSKYVLRVNKSRSNSLAGLTLTRLTQARIYSGL